MAYIEEPKANKLIRQIFEVVQEHPVMDKIAERRPRAQGLYSEDLEDKSPYVQEIIRERCSLFFGGIHHLTPCALLKKKVHFFDSTIYFRRLWMLSHMNSQQRGDKEIFSSCRKVHFGHLGVTH